MKGIDIMVTVKARNGKTYGLTKKEFLNYMLRLKARRQAERDIDAESESSEESESEK